MGNTWEHILKFAAVAQLMRLNTSSNCFQTHIKSKISAV